MKAKENEILLIYNSEKQQDRKTKGYAASLEGHQLNERDVMTDNITETQLAEIANDLSVKMEELVDKNSEYYMSELKGKSFSDDELTKLMVRHRELIRTPIAYMGAKAFFVGSSYDFVNKDFEVKGVTSKKANQFEK